MMDADLKDCPKETTSDIINFINNYPKFDKGATIPSEDLIEFRELLSRLPIGIIFCLEHPYGVDTYEKTNQVEYIVQEAPRYDFTLRTDSFVAQSLLTRTSPIIPKESE